MPDPVAIVTGAAGGLDRIGWTTADPFPAVRDSLEERVASGRSARLGFTFSDPARSTAPTATWPWARSIVVGLHSYLPEAGSPVEEGRVARFAERDHYRMLRRSLDDVRSALTDAGHRAEISVDDSRLVDRAAAHRAGLAWWGKNTMLLSPGLGPWFLIGCVVTDAEFPPAEQMTRDCGTCSACLPACPTGALVAPGVLDARRCLAAILQSPGPIPVEFRASVGDRLYGCDDCIEACPPGSRLLASATEERGAVDPRAVLTWDDEELHRRFDHFFLPGNDVRWLRRNALVALGNVGTEEDLILLAGHLDHPDRMLAEHARWAISSVGGDLSERILAADGQSAAPMGK